MGKFRAMIWGGIAKGCRTDLFVWDLSKGSFTSALYAKILEEYACQFIDEEFLFF